LIEHLLGNSAIDPDGSFRHTALLYSGEREFVEGVARFVREGVVTGEPVLVAVSAAKIERLREELGQDADEVLFANMDEIGANPGRIISAWDDFLRDHGVRGESVRGVGEPIGPDRDHAALAECHRHEALLNLAFADAAGFRLLCPYDVDALDPHVVEHARVTHPLVDEDGVERFSATYGGLESACSPPDAPLSEPPDRARTVPFDADSLGAVRTATWQLAVTTGLDDSRIDDLLIAVNELASNSVRHGGGRGVVRLWSEDDALVCEVSDCGQMTQPLAGRLRPGEGQADGYGLWLVNQLCDLMQVRVRADGTDVRLRMTAG
jgi:anti-sigma regulatory factor (Ser/Thr protein kinase)